MSRYSITVEIKSKSVDTLEEALSTFSGMMCIDKEQVRKEILEKGESHQAYGFCTGSIYDNQFGKAA